MTLAALAARLVSLVRRRRLDAELDDELRYHLEMSAAAHERRGLTAEAARRAARLEFGPVERLKDEYRERRGVPWLDQLAQDARYAARTLRRDVRFTAVAVATLALGIGATTAIFSLLRGVVLEPLPYPAPAALLRVFHSSPRFPSFPLSPASFVEYRRHARSLDGIAVYVREDLQLAADDRPERVQALQVSAGYFDVLGLRPSLGRGFRSAEEREGSRVVVISHALWQRRFAGDPAIVGRTIRLSGEPFVVVGVAAKGFEHVGGAYRSLPHGETVDAWWPVPLERAQERKGWHYLNAVARAGRGYTPAQVAGELDRIEAALTPPGQDDRWRVRAVSLEDEIIGSSQDGLALLMGAVAIVMLIACANVASLLLARGTARNRERAVRFALGASRGRLARQALTEGAVLMLPGALAGVALAVLGVRVLVNLMPADFPRLHNVRVDGAVLAFTALLACVSVAVFALFPALQGSGASAPALHDGGARTTAGRARVARNGLVVAEVALAAVLLVGAGLLLRSFVVLARQAPGFHADGVITFSLMLPPARYEPPERASRFSAALVERLQTLPGVSAAGAASDLPWTGYDENTGFEVAGRPVAAGADEPNARFHRATPGFFESLGVPLVDGRGLSSDDRAGRPPVVVVNETLATRYFPGERAVGRELGIWGERCRIVGVVGDIKDGPLEAEAVPAFWWPMAQAPASSMSVAVRTRADLDAIAGDLRRTVRALDPELPMAELKPLGDIARAATAERRFLLVIVGLFGGLAVALAAVGAYGVLAWTVQQRSRELGIRVALGATRPQLVSLVMAEGLRLAAAGVALGALVAAAGAGLLQSMLVGVAPRDPLTFASVIIGILTVAGAASLVPALQATRATAVEVLRLD